MARSIELDGFHAERLAMKSRSLKHLRGRDYGLLRSYNYHFKLITSLLLLHNASTQ
jgi:hypothetical protein